jgi:hypothetical protein
MKAEKTVTILDRFGQQLGLALGLRELGFRIEYWMDRMYSQDMLQIPHYSVFKQPVKEIILRQFDSVLEKPKTGAITVWIESFTDWYDTLNDAAYGIQMLSQLPGIADAIVFDSSDNTIGCIIPELPGRVFLKRETAQNQSARWKPFSYLHSFFLLGTLSAITLPQATDRYDYDLIWMGSLHSERNHWLEAARATGTLKELHVGFFPYLLALSHTRAGLYLPGRGWICYRLHELLALGVPLVYVEPPILLNFPIREMGITIDEYISGCRDFPSRRRIKELHEEFYSPRACAREFCRLTGI